MEYGITSENCNYNLISNNTINHNGIGISLDSGLNNSIIGNNISQNEGDGIVLVESYNHTISFNTLVGNQKGVVEDNCEGNKILNNTIENRVVPLKKNMIPSYNSLIVIGSLMSTVIVICYGKKRFKLKLVHFNYILCPSINSICLKLSFGCLFQN